VARIRQRADGAWSARIRYGEGLDEWFALDVDPALAPERRRAAAEDRRKRLQRLAKLLRDSGKLSVSRIILEQAASERSDRAFRNIEVTVEGFTADLEDKTAKARTFRQVVQLYTSGELHALYPDDVPFKGKASLDASSSALSVFLPVLGDKTFEQITLDDIDAAKRLIPQKSRGSTRRAYIRELRRVMNLAVEPLRLVEQVVPVKIPKKQMGEDRLFAFLYPDEEGQLDSCDAIPYWRRWLYAWIFRNGTRISETLQATWDHVNLQTGQFHLDQAWTKKKRARFWILEPDVLRAMKLHHDKLDPKPKGSDLIFPGGKGQRITHHSMIRKHLQADLVTAGLTRRELFTEAEGERALTTHDTRATFVTLARRRGWSDQRIMDHTGHIHASQLAQYNRLVRAAEQLHLAWFTDMDVVLGFAPEQQGGASGPRLGHVWESAGKSAAAPFSSANVAIHASGAFQLMATSFTDQASTLSM
jgi:integrase